MTSFATIALVWIVGGILSACYTYGSLWNLANDPIRRMNEFAAMSILFGVIGGPTLFALMMYEKFMQHQPRYFKIPFTQ